MKILFIITSLNYGGAEIQVKELSTEMKLRNHKVAILSLIQPHPDFDAYFRSKSIPVWNLHLKPSQYNPLVIFKANRIIKKYNPEIVHSHMVHANIMSRICRLFVRFPVLICTAHNISEGGKLRELAYRFTDYLTDLTTNVSQVATDTYVKKKLVSVNKVKFVPNGISINDNKNLEISTTKKLNKEFGSNKNMFIWLAVGRLSLQKNYNNLINAAVILKERSRKFIILIAGVGELEENLKKLVFEKKISEYVKFIGLRKDIKELMLFSNAFVMSSAWEGLPIVLLEAAINKLPIVATDVGGNKEIVIENQNGKLVPPNNSESLADAMFEIMNFSEDKIRDYAENGYKRIISSYSIHHVVDLWINIYNGLLKKI